MRNEKVDVIYRDKYKYAQNTQGTVISEERESAAGPAAQNRSGGGRGGVDECPPNQIPLGAR